MFLDVIGARRSQDKTKLGGQGLSLRIGAASGALLIQRKNRESCSLVPLRNLIRRQALPRYTTQLTERL